MYKVILICLIFIGAQHSDAQIYKWVDKNGHTQFSDKPPPSTFNKKNQGVLPSRLVGKTKSTPTYPSSIILKLRDLLEQKEFSALNKFLEQYQVSADSNISEERSLFTAYRAFEIKDKTYEALFNAWVKSTPNKYQPYLARAKYYYRLGWLSRGTKWASETKKEQMQEMLTYLNKAKEDIASALAINNQSMVPYSLLISITNTLGNEIETKAVLTKALKINPATYVVRASYLNSLTPRWGGSYEKMQSFVEQSQVYTKENPKIKLLGGDIYADAADMQAISGAYNTAEKLYTKALSFGEYHVRLYERGKNSFRQKNYQKSLNDLNRAIEIYPENAKYYYWRANTLSQLNQHRQATEDILYASKLDPGDQSIQELRKWMANKLVRQGYELRNNTNKSSEIDKYDYALRLQPNDASTYYRRARAYLAQNNIDLAIQDLNNSIKLEPNNIDHYILIDYALAQRNEWKKIIKYWDEFIALNPNNGKAYLERGGAYYRSGDRKSAVKDAKRSADLGNLKGKEAYERFR